MVFCKTASAQVLHHSFPFPMIAIIAERQMRGQASYLFCCCVVNVHAFFVDIRKERDHETSRVLGFHNSRPANPFHDSSLLYFLRLLHEVNHESCNRRSKLGGEISAAIPFFFWKKVLHTITRQCRAVALWWIGADSPIQAL